MNSVDTFCLKCKQASEVMEFFISEDIELDELENLPIRIIGFKEVGKFTCSLCEEELELGEYFADSKADYERFLELSTERIGEVLSMKVEHCSKCPDGEIIESFHWAVNNEEGTDDYSGTDFYDFLDEFGINDYYLKQEVLNHIQCASCGFGAEEDKDVNRMFELSDKVLSSQQISEFFGDDYGLDIKKLNKIAIKYDIELSKNEIEDFINKISENPMLAYQYETGIKLYNLFKEILKHDDVYFLESGEKLFRGRNRKKDEDKFSSSQLWSPPVGNAGHGRYNLIGIPVLYCSNTTNGLPYELNPLNNDFIDVATFQVIKQMRLLDISEIFNGEFGEYISSVNYESKKLKKGYLFTNYIKDCCASLGFGGIRYSGVGKEDYQNYALFNYGQEIDIKVLDDVITIDCNISYIIQKKDN